MTLFYVLQGGDSSIKRVKVEHEIEQRAACDDDSGEKGFRASEQPMGSESMDVDANMSDANELSKEMNGMKIDENKIDDHDTNVKVWSRLLPYNFNVLNVYIYFVIIENINK